MDDTIPTDGKSGTDRAAVDMIVMATPGLSRRRRALCRSLSSRVVRRPIGPILTNG
ncbi:universal stress protein [Halosolutus halophilus]|uniref:universal stress protein n=1 Tax=Halosolutus halophilus TaxID=1552990 RepID=UPI0022351CA3|nr:universal stress protein [Halosolutus halophilus]